MKLQKRAVSKNWQSINFKPDSQAGKMLDWLRAGLAVTGEDARKLFKIGSGFCARITQIRNKLVFDGNGEELLSHRVPNKTYFVYYLKGLKYDFDRQETLKAVGNLINKENITNG